MTTTNTKHYIYAKVLKVITSAYGKNLQVVVVKNKNYTGKITEYEGTDFAYIKERLYKNYIVENGKYYRFLVLEMGEYMAKSYIKRLEITELPQNLQDKYDKESKEKWLKEQEKQEEEFQNHSPASFSDDE